MELTTTPNSNQSLEVKIQATINQLAKTLLEAQNRPPIQLLLNKGTDPLLISKSVSILILKASRSLSVSGNLKEGQAHEIALEIIRDYPLLSIDDINLVLLNGCKGKYGQIFRFDISVIYDWIRIYEEEKAEFLEDIRPKEEPIVSNAKEVSPETQQLINDFMINLLKEGGMRGVPSVDYKDLLDAKLPLKEKAASQGVKYSSWDEIRDFELKIEWARECTHLHTGDLLPGKPTFQEWLKKI